MTCEHIAGHTSAQLTVTAEQGLSQRKALRGFPEGMGNFPSNQVSFHFCFGIEEVSFQSQYYLST